MKEGKKSAAQHFIRSYFLISVLFVCTLLYTRIAPQKQARRKSVFCKKRIQLRLTPFYRLQMFDSVGGTNRIGAIRSQTID